MGGQGSGRKPDVLNLQNRQISYFQEADAEQIIIPNLSGVKHEIKDGTSNISTDDLSQGSINLYSQWANNGNDIYYNNGKVGIGTTSPSTKLEVIGNILINHTGAGGLIVDTQGAGSSRNIKFTNSGSGTKYNWLIGAQNNVDNAFEITPSTAVGGSTYSTPSMTILNSGNVGIGTTSPSQKLDVVGNINIDGTSAYLYGGYSAIKLATKGDTSDYTSTILGRGAGDTKTDGTTTRQTAVGYAAGNSNTGSSQTAVGYLAGYQNTGNYQTAVGYAAGNSNTGSSQTAVGYLAGYQNTGHRVIGIGYEATRGNLVDDVVAIGYQAGKDNNVANQFIVKQANINAVPLIQGNFATGNVGIGTTSPSEVLEVSGSVKATGYKSSDGSAGITQTIVFNDADATEHTLVFKNGLLTSYTTA